MCAAICPGEGEKFYPHSSTEEGLSPGARKEKKSFLYTWTYMGGKPRYHVSALKIPLLLRRRKGKGGGWRKKGKKLPQPTFIPFGDSSLSFGGKTNYGVGCDPVLTDWRGLVGSTPFRFPFHAQTKEKKRPKSLFISDIPLLLAHTLKSQGHPFAPLLRYHLLGH